MKVVNRSQRTVGVGGRIEGFRGRGWQNALAGSTQWEEISDGWWTMTVQRVARWRLGSGDPVLTIVGPSCMRKMRLLGRWKDGNSRKCHEAVPTICDASL